MLPTTLQRFLAAAMLALLTVASAAWGVDRIAWGVNYIFIPDDVTHESTPFWEVAEPGTCGEDYPGFCVYACHQFPAVIEKNPLKNPNLDSEWVIECILVHPKYWTHPPEPPEKEVPAEAEKEIAL